MSDDLQREDFDCGRVWFRESLRNWICHDDLGSEQEEYFLNCLRYIELNPVRAGIVNDPGNYKWSSYRAHAFGVKAKMWSPHALYSDLGMSDIARQSHYRKWMSQAMAAEVLGKIRACLEKGLVLGTDRFREQVSGLMR